MTKKTDIYTFFSSFPQRDLVRGEILLEPCEHVNHLYYLARGYIRMYSLLPNGNELTITLFKPGAYIPLFLAVDDSKNSYYYEAFSTVVVFQAPTIAVIRFIKGNTETLFDATKRMGSGLHGLVENLQHQLFGSVRQRLIATILLLAKQFGVKTHEGINIIIPLTHEDIAKFLGVARETVSIEMKKLQEEKGISYSYKHLTVIRHLYLQQEVNTLK